MLIGGQKGHLFSCDWLDRKPLFDVQVPSTIRDVHYLQNEVICAVAHPKYVTLYDKQGIQIQIMKDHIDVNKLDFLPYHLLLATIVWLFSFILSFSIISVSLSHLFLKHRVTQVSSDTMMFPLET